MKQGKYKLQKVNPTGKYNQKEWIRLGQRDIFDINEMDMLIYNDKDISHVYDRTKNMYVRKNGPGKSGRPKKNKNEQE